MLISSICSVLRLHCVSYCYKHCSCIYTFSFIFFLLLVHLIPPINISSKKVIYNWQGFATFSDNTISTCVFQSLLVSNLLQIFTLLPSSPSLSPYSSLGLCNLKHILFLLVLSSDETSNGAYFPQQRSCMQNITSIFCSIFQIYSVVLLFPWGLMDDTRTRSKWVLTEYSPIQVYSNTERAIELADNNFAYI